jgi:hypothetical protein
MLIYLPFISKPTFRIACNKFLCFYFLYLCFCQQVKFINTYDNFVFHLILNPPDVLGSADYKGNLKSTDPKASPPFTTVLCRKCLDKYLLTFTSILVALDYLLVRLTTRIYLLCLRFMALPFTATGASPSARRIRILPINQYPSWPITFGMKSLQFKDHRRC